MKALVGIKRVIDPNVAVYVKSDGSGVEVQNVKMGINPFDEIALEEAVRQKEAGIISEVLIFSIGDKKCIESLQMALALGADKAIYIKSDVKVETLNVAKVIKALSLEHEIDLVILGKQAIDDDSNHVGQMTSALLNWPQATFISKLDINKETGEVCIFRETDYGLEELKLTLPAVITTDLRLNEPRIASLPKIMQAKKKEIIEIDIDKFGLDLTPKIQELNVKAPSVRVGGEIVGSTDELCTIIKNIVSIR